jgi:hypothetical protein
MHWRGFLNAAFGIWLISSPFTFGYKSELLAQSDIVCGLLAILFGLLTVHRQFFAWGTALVGLWLQLAPLVFWAPEAASYINDTFIGLLLLVFSIIIPDTPGAKKSTGAEVPPGWSYNPSSYLQRTPVIFLNIVCWLIARYLAAFQLGFIDTVWDPFFGDGTLHVLTSNVSKAFPVSDAGLGATAYLLETLFAFGDVRRWHTMPWFVMMFGVLAIPVSCVSITLIILQPTIVGAWCGLCLITAVLMLLIIPFTVDEVAATLQVLKKAYRNGEFWSVFWCGAKVKPGPADPRTPRLNASYWQLWKAMCHGVTVPWNLLVAALVGIYAMFQGAFIPGALIVVFAVISWGEVVRFLRYAMIPWAVWLLFVQPLAGVIVIALSFRKGKIRESYGTLGGHIKSRSVDRT